MTLHTRSAGAWATVQDLYIRQSGVWVPVQQAYVRNAGAWTEYYAAEVVVTIAANSTNVNISALFTSGDWSSAKKKRVIVQSGVTIGSTASGTPAMRTGTGWGGQLTLDNAGTIQGAGGVLNSGIGGGALLADAAGLIVNNTGTIRSGGGGGGQGGAGSTTSTTRQPSSGYAAWDPYYNTISYFSAGNSQQLYWEGVDLGYVTGNPASRSTGGWTYYRGPAANGGTYDYSEGYGLAIANVYSIYREQSTTVGTTGGNGGRGAGHDGAAAAGAAGGTNAGAGGSGGAYGATGSTGAAGNAGSGVAGGLAGISYNAANITMNNTGTITGRTS